MVNRRDQHVVVWISDGNEAKLTNWLRRVAESLWHQQQAVAVSRIGCSAKLVS
jgi:hypothetical protein